MAGIDYCSCYVCGKRLFYDGEWAARGYMREDTMIKYIVCDHCYEKKLKRISKLEKAAKRGK